MDRDAFASKGRNRVAAYGVLAALAVAWSSGAPALEADEVFQRMAPAVVLITVSDGLERIYGTASGVVVAPGEIVTNCHVVAGATRVTVTQATAARPRGRISTTPIRSGIFAS